MFYGLTSNVLAMDKLAAPWCLGSNLMNSLAVSCVACVGFCQCTTNPCHGVGQRRRTIYSNTSAVLCRSRSLLIFIDTLRGLPALCSSRFDGWLG